MTRPNVVVDLRASQSRHHAERGIARYTTELARTLEAVNPSLVTNYLVDPSFPMNANLRWAIATGKVRRSDDVGPQMRAAGGVFLVCSPFEEAFSLETIVPSWARGPRWRTAAILYDLIPLLYPDEYLDHPHAKSAYVGRLPILTNADRLFAISKTSKDDAVRLLNVPEQRIDVIFAGAGDEYRPADQDRVAVASDLIESGHVPGLRSRYLLFTGGPDFRKNMAGVLAAFGRLGPDFRRDHQLVIVCKLNPESERQVRAMADEHGVTDDVLFTGFVSDELLVRLTQGAELGVFPSLYEGFGLPVLEARRCGTPVVCSNNSSLAEVMPDPAARFQADDPSAMAAAIEHAVSTPGELERLASLPISDDFTWTRAAEKVDTSLRLLLADVQRIAASRLGTIRAGLVLDGTLPEATRRELTSTCDEASIEVFAGDDAALRLVAHEAVNGSVDLLVHALWHGSSPAAVDLATSRPGVVILLDANLCDPYGIGIDGFREQHGRWMAAHYPGRYRAIGPGIVDIGENAATESGMLALAEVTQTADRVVTWHPMIASLAQLDCGVEAMVVPLPDADALGQDPMTDRIGEVDMARLTSVSGFVPWLTSLVTDLVTACGVPPTNQRPPGQ